MTQLPPWAGRAAALALLVAALGLVALVVVYPVVSYSNRLSERIEESNVLLARLENLTQARGEFEAQIDALSAHRAQDSLYLPGTSEGVAAANLQRLIKRAVDAHGGQLKSTQSLSARDDETFPRVTIRVILEANVAALAEILYDLESQRPFVFIENLDVKAQRRRSRGEDAETDAELIIRFDLYGYPQRMAG